MRWQWRREDLALVDPGDQGRPVCLSQEGGQGFRPGVSAQLAGWHPQGCSPPPEAEMGHSKPQFSLQKSGCGTR